MKYDPATTPAYMCRECGGTFENPNLGHCPECHHHYEAGTECRACHKHTLHNSMKETGLSSADVLLMFKFDKEERNRFLRTNPHNLRSQVKELFEVAFGKGVFKA